VPSPRRIRSRALALAALAVSAALVLSSCAAGPQYPAPIEKQLDYAMKHWDHYNTKVYGDLNSEGGDCANFVSQTLIARGWTMNDQWYNHDAAASWSPAWGYVPSMEDYFSENTKQLGLTEYPFDKRKKIQVGDLVMFDLDGNGSLDHIEMVSKIADDNGAITIYMSGHNKNTKYSDLDTVLKEYPHAIGHFWHIALPPSPTATPTKAS
jgi:hypothetical protein